MKLFRITIVDILGTYEFTACGEDIHSVTCEVSSYVRYGSITVEEEV